MTLHRASSRIRKSNISLLPFRLLGALILTTVIPVAGSTAAAQPPTEVASHDLQASIDSAEPGSTLIVESGTYQGGIVIDKPLTLKGEGRPIIDAGGNGHVIEVISSDVTLEGLVIRGSGISVESEDSGIRATEPRLRVIDNEIEDVLFGVHLSRVDDAEIRGNTITGKDLFISRRGDGLHTWECERVQFVDNIVTSSRDVVFWYSRDLTIQDNRLSGNRYGLHFMYSDRATVDSNVISDNSVGSFLMYAHDVVMKDNVISNSNGSSGYGIGLKDVDRLEITGNRLLSNRVGMFVDNSPSGAGVVHHVKNNVIAFNETGLLLMPAVKNNVFSENALMENTEQVGIAGLGKLRDVEWSHEGRGNYWSDYAGYDAEGDGVGDLPYRLEDLFSSMTDSHPELAFFTGTPAAQAVDMAGRAFPDLRPDPKLVDEHPLVDTPDFPSMPGNHEGADSGPVLLVSLGMVAMAAAVLSLGRVRHGREFAQR